MPFRITGATPSHTVALCLRHGWSIVIRCNAGHEGRIGLEGLQAMPEGTTLEAIAARAVCSQCGSREGMLSTVAGGWASAVGRGGSMTTAPRRPSRT